jgi:hypothetical protein
LRRGHPVILSAARISLQARTTLRLTKLSDLIAREEDSAKRADLLEVLEGKLEAEKGKLEAEKNGLLDLLEAEKGKLEAEKNGLLDLLEAEKGKLEAEKNGLLDLLEAEKGKLEAEKNGLVNLLEAEKGKLEAEKGKLEAEIEVVLMREKIARTALLAATGALHMRGYLGEHPHRAADMSTSGLLYEMHEGPRSSRCFGVANHGLICPR